MIRAFALAFIPLFVATAVVGLLPVYLDLTKGLGEPERRRVAIEATLTAAGVGLGFLVVGDFVLHVLEVSVSDFQVASGILLLVISIYDLPIRTGRYARCRRGSAWFRSAPRSSWARRLGCDLHCTYCQNYVTSQALRDPVAGVLPELVTPTDIVEAAVRHRARILTSTYNEPLITSEWAVEVFREGRAHGLVGSFVSNGNATAEVLEYLRPWVDLYKVDLKGFDDRRYRKLGGVLQNVLDTIQLLHAKGFWLEVVTLVVPGFNDSDAELRDLAQFLAAVSRDIPWHVTAFHADYKMLDRPGMSAATLLRAAELGLAAGLRYVYAGNLPGQVGPFENTWCPTCRALLIARIGFTVLQDRLTPSGGVCPDCRTHIAGHWQ